MIEDIDVFAILHQVAVARGRKGGKVSTPAKAEAARRNAEKARAARKAKLEEGKE